MKRYLAVLLLLALAISACQGAAMTQSAPTQSVQLSPVASAPAATVAAQEPYAAPTNTALPSATDTLTPEDTTPTQLAQASPAAPPGCTVVSQKPNPTIESLFPPVTSQDWQQGPSDAQVTILEYGDFM